MGVTTGDFASNIPLAGHQFIRANATSTDFDTGTIVFGTELATVATTGAYADLSGKPTIPTAKRIETYAGTTTSTGYTVTYATAFSATPDVQPQIQAASATNTTTVRITASSTTGFTIVVSNRTDVLGLLPSYANVTGASVSVLVTER